MYLLLVLFTHILSVDERERSVLESTAAVPFGVDVRHLLQLEGPLHGHGFTVPLAQYEAVALVVQPDRSKVGGGGGVVLLCSAGLCG